MAAQELRPPDRVDEQSEMLAAIDEGIAQLDAGQTLSTKEVEQRLDSRLHRRRSPETPASSV
jgi:predicted transcriptional regulator